MSQFLQDTHNNICNFKSSKENQNSCHQGYTITSKTHTHTEEQEVFTENHLDRVGN